MARGGLGSQAHTCRGQLPARAHRPGRHPEAHEGRSVPMADSVATELERHFQRSRFCVDSDLVFGPKRASHSIHRSCASVSSRPCSGPASGRSASTSCGTRSAPSSLRLASERSLVQIQSPRSQETAANAAVSPF